MVDGVPELRASKQPWPTWVKVVGFVCGMLSAGGVTAGGVLGWAGKTTVNLAVEAVAKRLDPKFEALSIQERADSTVESEHHAATVLALAKMQRQIDAMSRSSQTMLRRLKLPPTAPVAAPDTPRKSDQ
jgi:hypothetical protein